MVRKTRATYEKGVLRLAEKLPLADGTRVDVTIVANEKEKGRLQESDESSWDALSQLLRDCAIDTGITDLARSHDRYLYGRLTQRH